MSRKRSATSQIGQLRQRVIATLGRLDELEASGQLERLVRAGARFAARAMVVTAAQDAPTAAVRRIGPALVFERPWAETGCRDDVRPSGKVYARARVLSGS